MSEELIIVFLYDCDMCKREEDDPQEAIIYFYPTWVSLDQRHALCSQLMGVNQFFTSSFAPPSVISLQSGKFALRKTGRFALCVGSDRNIPDSILRNRLSSLCEMLSLFHCSIEVIESQLTDDDDDSLGDTFSQFLQIYLPIVLDGAYTFENIPLFKLPKKCISVLDDARYALEDLQTMNGVLGGAILHQNKMIFSQFNRSLTKQIVLAHPYKIKLPAQNIETLFELPPGVQLLKVFVDNEEVECLKALFKKSQNEKSNDQRKSTHNCLPSTSTSGCQLHYETSQNAFMVECSSPIPDLVKDTVKAKLDKKNARDKIEGKTEKFEFYVPSPSRQKTSMTTDDILTTTNIPMRCLSFGLPKVDPSWTDRKKTNQPPVRKDYYNTICDPKYPLFKPNGLPASYNFFMSGVKNHYMYKRKRLKSVKELRKSVEMLDRNGKADRKLTLSLSKYSDQPPPKGTPLTPLLAKLSFSLAGEETFIDDPPEVPATSQNETNCVSHKKKTAQITNNSTLNGNQPITQLILFIFGFNSSSITLLLEHSAVSNNERLQILWEKCNIYLSSIDEELENTVDLDSPCEGISSAGEYSYAVVDNEWGPVEKGGFQHPNQLEMLNVLHKTMSTVPAISDILVREEESVIYACRSDNLQIFYQQNCSNNSGVPDPSDLMGVIPLKAAGVLSRDHQVNLQVDY